MKEPSKPVTDSISCKGKILLLGGAGYIGSVVTQYFLDRQYRVCCYDSLLYGVRDGVLPFLSKHSYQFIRGDICDVEKLKAAADGAQAVVILAGLVGDPIARKYPDEARETNLEGMKRVIHALGCYHQKRIVFLSTCSNYGFISSDEVADENFPLSPLSSYAKAKVAVEEEILSLKGKVEPCFTILRFATAFGLSPRMRFDLTVNEFVAEFYKGHEVTVYDQDTWRPYCHVRDFAAAIECALEAPKERVSFEVFNVGSDHNNYTKKMLVEEVKRQIPNAQVLYQKHGSDPRSYKVSFKKIREQLFFEPKVSVPEGIKEILATLETSRFTLDGENWKARYGNYEFDSKNKLQTAEAVRRL